MKYNIFSFIHQCSCVLFFSHMIFQMEKELIRSYSSAQYRDGSEFEILLQLITHAQNKRKTEYLYIYLEISLTCHLYVMVHIDVC